MTATSREITQKRRGPLSPAPKHQVLAGGALGFYGMKARRAVPVAGL